MQEIEFRETKNIDFVSLQELFRSEQWSDYMELDDVEFYINASPHVVTAWDGDKIVGFGRLEGDGRISLEISDVLVRSDYQDKGIGTEIVRRLVQKCREMDPYYIQVSPVGDKAAHIYEKLGFTDIPDYRQLELITGKLGRKTAQVRGKKPA